MKCVRIVMALGLFAACASMSFAQQSGPGVEGGDGGGGGGGGQGQGGPSIKFTGGSPAAGAFKGSINISVQWTNCAKLGEVTANCWTANKGNLVKQVTVQGTAQNPLQTSGQYSWTPGNIPSGTVIAVAEAAAFDNTALPAPGNLIITTGPRDATTNPPYPGCTVP